jgi:uncharacterized protein
MAIVLITGASSGIGKDLAEIFASQKNDLILVARSKDVLNDMAIDLERRYGGKVNYFDIDLSLPNSGIQLYDSVKDLGQSIDILINNAGYGLYGENADLEAEKVSNMLTLNINSLTQLTLLFSQDMKKAGRGKIMNVASTASFQPVPYMAAYAASKAYVLSFSEALHVELKKYGVTVSALCPGATETNFAKTANAESSKLFLNGAMSSREVAQKAYEGLMKNKTVIITGLMNNLLSRSVSFLPRGIVASVAAKMMK